MPNLEQFVDADTTAKFLAITRRHLLDLTRARVIPSYPVSLGRRRYQYRYRLTEVAQAMADNAAGLPSRVITRMKEPKAVLNVVPLPKKGER